LAAAAVVAHSPALAAAVVVLAAPAGLVVFLPFISPPMNLAAY
jgi:hypothetical protein